MEVCWSSAGQFREQKNYLFLSFFFSVNYMLILFSGIEFIYNYNKESCQSRMQRAGLATCISKNKSYVSIEVSQRRSSKTENNLIPTVPTLTA